MSTYDLLIYHDLSDYTDRTGGRIPDVGADAEDWFGGLARIDASLRSGRGYTRVAS